MSKNTVRDECCVTGCVMTAALLAVALFSGCERREGESRAAAGAGVQQVFQYPVESVFVSFFSTPALFHLSGKDSDLDVTLTYSVDPLPETPGPRLPGSPDKAVRIRTYERKGGRSFNHSADIDFISAPFEIRSVTTQNGKATYTPSEKLPSLAQVGESGRFAYVAYGPGAQVENSRIGWSLEPDTPNTAWLCMNETPDGIDPAEADKTCLRIDRKGTVSGLKLDRFYGLVQLREETS